MDYALALQVCMPDPISQLGERKSRYAPSWYEKREVAGDNHPITATAEKRVLQHGGAPRWRAILARNSRLSQRMPPGLRADWLALEEALHAHWLAIAAEHYNLGVEDGLRRCAGRRRKGPLTVRERLEQLALDLLRAAEEL